MESVNHEIVTRSDPIEPTNDEIVTRSHLKNTMRDRTCDEDDAITGI
jgi:hypothetical protein